MAEEILIFEGAKTMKHCVRKKRVYSERLGRHVLRCAEFADGDLGDMGDMGQITDEIKDTLITGAVAAGGAVISKAVVENIVTKQFDLSPTWEIVANVVAGFALGWGAVRVGLDANTAAALTIGPVVVGAVQLLGELAKTSNGDGNGDGTSGWTTAQSYPNQFPLTENGANALGGYVTAEQYQPSNYVMG